MSAESYLSRGVSPTKEDVHKAIANQSKGLYPGAFCKIVEDIHGDENYCTLMHADGAGTKSILAYIQYKETGDASVFRGISQDSLVMNIDDLLCVGAVDRFLVSNTIGRNAHRVDGKVLKEVIGGYDRFAAKLGEYGVDVILSGGETADVGDIVATIIVDSTVFVRLPRNKVVDCSNITAGDVIVGFASFGQAVYEESYNSGIGSNGLTAARHLVLSNAYAVKYPETYSPTIEKGKEYCGRYRMEDKLPGSVQTVGEALLSPTRTYAPVIREILQKHFASVHGMIHCTGGGQVKCKNFGHGLHYIKEHLFPTPPVFELIRNESDIAPQEMYQVFNMGHRMEVYCPREAASNMIEIAGKYGIEAKIVGHVEQNASPDANKVTIVDGGKEFIFG